MRKTFSVKKQFRKIQLTLWTRLWFFASRKLFHILHAITVLYNIVKGPMVGSALAVAWRVKVCFKCMWPRQQIVCFTITSLEMFEKKKSCCTSTRSCLYSQFDTNKSFSLFTCEGNRLATRFPNLALWVSKANKDALLIFEVRKCCQICPALTKTEVNYHFEYTFNCFRCCFLDPLKITPMDINGNNLKLLVLH